MPKGVDVNIGPYHDIFAGNMGRQFFDGFQHVLFDRDLSHATKAYLYERKLDGSPCRFDVISIVLQGVQEPAIEHFEDVF